MKRIFSAAVALTLVLSAFADSFEPNTKWPYLYESFTSGTVYSENNEKSESLLNVHLSGNVLHFINSDGRVCQTPDKGVIRVEIGSDAYIFSNHKLMQILDSNGTNVLLLLQRGAFDRIRKSGTGAYGADLTSSSTRNLSSFDMAGIGMPELGKMLQEKNDGYAIPLVKEYYFVINGVQIDADKKSVEECLSEEKKAQWPAFLKENKIKWKKPESLKKVLEFLSK